MYVISPLYLITVPVNMLLWVRFYINEILISFYYYFLLFALLSIYDFGVELMSYFEQSAFQNNRL